MNADGEQVAILFDYRIRSVVWVFEWSADGIVAYEDMSTVVEVLWDKHLCLAVS